MFSKHAARQRTDGNGNVVAKSSGKVTLFDPRSGRTLTFMSAKRREQWITKELRRMKREADGVTLDKPVERYGVGSQRLGSMARSKSSPKPRHEQWRKVTGSNPHDPLDVATAQRRGFVLEKSVSGNGKSLEDHWDSHAKRWPEVASDIRAIVECAVWSLA